MQIPHNISYGRLRSRLCRWWLVRHVEVSVSTTSVNSTVASVRIRWATGWRQYHKHEHKTAFPERHDIEPQYHAEWGVDRITVLVEIAVKLHCYEFGGIMRTTFAFSKTNTNKQADKYKLLLLQLQCLSHSKSKCFFAPLEIKRLSTTTITHSNSK